jgi:membrane protein implicated in regulation of membrane protease activity
MAFNLLTILAVIFAGAFMLIPIAAGKSWFVQLGLILVWSVVIAAILAYLADRSIRKEIEARQHGQSSSRDVR